MGVPRSIVLLFGVYIILSFFEIYLSSFIGESSKYVLLLMIGLWTYFKDFKIKLNILSKFFLVWLIFKFASLLWSSMENNDVRLHLISQVGMVMFVFVGTADVYSQKFLTLIVRLLYWNSFAFGLLSIVFRGSYIDERFIARQVLTLWGNQNDPNNCCAFLAIGVGLSLYSLFCEKKNRLLNIIVILVNSYSIILSGSRGGFLLLVALLFIAVIFPNWNQKIVVSDTIKRIVILLVVVIIGIYIVERYVPAASLERVIAFDEYEGGSGRIEKWETALNLIKQRPILGWGWGGYTINGISAVHNTYLTMLCDIGVVGTFLFFSPIVYILVQAVKHHSMLSFIVLVMGLIPAFSIDSINKRFFWNAIIISFELIQYIRKNHDHITLWGCTEETSRYKTKLERRKLR